MYLRALASATPARSFSQADCLGLLKSSPATLARLDRRSRLMLATILRGDSGIEDRQFAIKNAENLFTLDADALNEEFRRSAPALGAEALSKALEHANLAPKSIDALIVTTCTGYLCPGVSSYVAEALRMRTDSWLQDIVGLGCGAAIPSLRAASSILTEKPDWNVACLSVEICSAAFYLDNDPGVIVSACLFGDGAAATIWSGSPKTGRLRCHSFSSLHQPEHRDLIRFEQRRGKLRNLLHPTVPRLAANAVSALHAEAIESGEHPIARILSHAGGRDVIDAIEKEIPGTQLDETREVLRRHGNMSSPSVLFALELALQEHSPTSEEDWWMTSFGAGFSAHSCRISAN